MLLFYCDSTLTLETFNFRFALLAPVEISKWVRISMNVKASIWFDFTARTNKQINIFSWDFASHKLRYICYNLVWSLIFNILLENTYILNDLSIFLTKCVTKWVRQPTKILTSAKLSTDPTAGIGMFKFWATYKPRTREPVRKERTPLYDCRNRYYYNLFISHSCTFHIGQRSFLVHIRNATSSAQRLTDWWVLPMGGHKNVFAARQKYYSETPKRVSSLEKELRWLYDVEMRFR